MLQTFMAIFSIKKKGIITMKLSGEAPIEVLIKNSSQFPNFPDMALVREIHIIGLFMLLL